MNVFSSSGRAWLPCRQRIHYIPYNHTADLYNA